MTFPIQKISLALKFPTAPQEIFFQGNAALLEKLPTQGLAIVGTRHSQARAETLVRKILLELRRQDLVIISGLALGIDSSAHRYALDAGLPTVAVLGCGLEHQYPPQNECLREKILREGGLVISEYAPHVEPQPFFFIRRNRLIAGLSRATWIVQAPLRSGALNTAKWTRDFGRTTYVTPSFPGDPSFAGIENLFIQDPRPIPIYNAGCLGETWLEFSHLSLKSKNRSVKNSASDPILEELRFRTAQVGGVTVSGLLDWAVACGYSPLDVFERLQKAQQCGSVSDENGVLVAT